MCDSNVPNARIALNKLENILQYVGRNRGQNRGQNRDKQSITRVKHLGEGGFGSVYMGYLINETTGSEMMVAVKYMETKHFNIFELVGLNIFSYLIGVYVRYGNDENDYNSRDKNPTLPHSDCGFNFLCSVSEIQNIPNIHPDCEICIVMSLFSCNVVDLPDNSMDNVNVIDALLPFIDQLLLLHSHGFQHNDIRADNVLCGFSPSGLVSFNLADFGCVCPFECDADHMLTYCELTPEYGGICDIITFFLNKKCIYIPEQIRKDLHLIVEHLFDEDYPDESHNMPTTFKELRVWLEKNKYISMSIDDMKCDEKLDDSDKSHISNGFDTTRHVENKALYTILTAELSNVSVTITRIKESAHEAMMYNHITCVESRVVVKKIKVEKFNQFMLLGLILANDLIGVYPSRVWENSERFEFCPEKVILFSSVVGVIENMSPNDEIVVVSQLYSCSLDNLDINVIQNIDIQNIDILSELPNLVKQLDLLHKQGFVHNDVKVKNVYCNIFSTKIDKNGLPVYKVSFHLGNFKNCYMGHSVKTGIFEDSGDIRGIGNIIMFLVKKIGIQKNPMLTTLYNRLFVIAKHISQVRSFGRERWTLENINVVLRQFCYKINN
jgi:serine/threonine protein kinase